MKKPVLLFLITFFFQTSWSQIKEICITFDDLPVVSYDFKDIEFQQSIIQKLIHTFNDYQIPAIGFVNESKLFVYGELNNEKVALLKMWLEAGYALGNHTYSHKDYHKVSYRKFTKDILKGEKVCKPLVKEYGQEYIYFRHPYLHVGMNKSSHDSLRAFLTKHGYEEAPVSIDNDDYIFAYAYNKAMLDNDEHLMKKIGNDYVDYMEVKLLFFENQSEKLFGRNIKHILLLHASVINADYIDELAERFKNNGYSFIAMEDALTDQAYQTEITKYNNWGISWLDRWALSQGKKGDFFKGDPVAPDYIKAYLDK
ncbi:MAG: polysaccharide deacetylase family protein [Cyclobacteriaceae bacterium]|nr:polysaccharide deacetylase family protein [Cyclobacteriaceae bacterium]